MDNEGYMLSQERGHREEREEEDFSTITNKAIKDGYLTEDEQLIAAAELARKRSLAKNKAREAEQREIAEKWDNRESVEGRLNEKMTSVEEIERAVQQREDGISKREDISFEGKSIKVFDLSGFPAVFLQHTLDYRSPESSGGMTPEETIEQSQRLIADPAEWIKEKPSDNHEEGKFANTDGRSLNISMSYIDTTRNLESGGARSKVGLTYGWGHLDEGRLLRIDPHDGRVPQNFEDVDINTDKYDFDELAMKRTLYNEVNVRRYDSYGKALPPDFLIVHDDKITEDTLKHASFFDPPVPILVIHDEAYREKSKESAESSAERALNETDYKDLLRDFRDANHYEYEAGGGNFEPMLRFSDEEDDVVVDKKRSVERMRADGVSEDLIKLAMEIEPKARLAYITEILKNFDKEHPQIFIEEKDVMRNDTTTGESGVVSSIRFSSNTKDFPLPDTVITSTNEHYDELMKLINENEIKIY